MVTCVCGGIRHALLTHWLWPSYPGLAQLIALVLYGLLVVGKSKRPT